jgi:hypothetical protein
MKGCAAMEAAPRSTARLVAALASLRLTPPRAEEEAEGCAVFEAPLLDEPASLLLAGPDADAAEEEDEDEDAEEPPSIAAGSAAAPELPTGRASPQRSTRA